MRSPQEKFQTLLQHHIENPNLFNPDLLDHAFEAVETDPASALKHNLFTPIAQMVANDETLTAKGREDLLYAYKTACSLIDFSYMVLSE